MDIATVIEKLDQLCQRLRPLQPKIYGKFVMSAPAGEDELQANEGLPFGLDPTLAEFWRTCSSLSFEWFVKMEGATEAGIESRVAPRGQFNLLTIEEAHRERNFLLDLAGDNRERFAQLMPFSKIDPGGEVLAVDHADGAGAVVAVFLDVDLTLVPLADDLPTWLGQRAQTYFEDSLIAPDAEMSDIVRVTLERLDQDEIEWPPERLGW